MNIASRQWLVPALVAGFGVIFAGSATAVPISFSAAGSNAASIQGAVNAFRSTVGTPNNGVAAGSQPTGRRELNWDINSGGTLTLIGNSTASFFADRGAVLTTPGTGFFIAPNSYPPFSSPNVLQPIGSNVLDVFFTVPQTEDPAATLAFGAVFADVDLAATTSLSFFGSANNFLGTYYASAFNNGLSFLGVVFSDPLEMIARVHISLGNFNGANLGGGMVDVVSLDDIIFGEPSAVGTPQSVSESSTFALFGLGLVGLGFARRRATASNLQTH